MSIALPNDLTNLDSFIRPEWDPTIDPSRLTAEAWQEHDTILDILKRAIIRKQIGEPFTRCPLIICAPGTGKTYLMMHAGAYAITQGLTVAVLSGNTFSLTLQFT